MTSLYQETPWDSLAFGRPTYELPQASEEALAAAAETPGHYTVRVDPLTDKSLLHRHGFYYCDTLVVPEVTYERFIAYEDLKAQISRKTNHDYMTEICCGGFEYDRFHRDFNVKNELADMRYINWLRQLADEGDLFSLEYDGELAGFFACTDHRIRLHAMAQRLRGRGLGKALWTRACEELFAAGHERLESSVSAANLAIVNLYASLGFRFRSPLDIYHRLTP
jgi:GNAT superfamily N-acetyltransferase